jgi:hypothetical protein
LAPSALGKSS